MPCQYAACFAATSLARRASGDLCVLATARHTRVCLRVAVLHKSPRRAAAVRLTYPPSEASRRRRCSSRGAANQAAFGIFECARRRAAAFFSRARSDVGFSRAIRGEEASPGGVACFYAALQSVASSHARLSLAPRANRIRRHRYARSSSRAPPPRSTNHSIHASCPPRRITGFSPQRPASSVKPRRRGKRRRKMERKKRTANEVRRGRADEAERSETADCGSRITPADASEARRRYPADKASRRGWRAVAAGAVR